MTTAGKQLTVPAGQSSHLLTVGPADAAHTGGPPASGSVHWQPVGQSLPLGLQLQTPPAQVPVAHTVPSVFGRHLPFLHRLHLPHRFFLQFLFFFFALAPSNPPTPSGPARPTAERRVERRASTRTRASKR
jgi:hypothetical protein